MPDVEFTNLLIVCLVAFAAPLALGFAPRLRMPAVVLEIVAGIVIGPSGLGWVQVDLPVQILGLVGLAFLLFLAGLEIDVHQLKGRRLRLAGTGFLASLGLGLAVGFGLQAAGLVSTPLLVAIILSATSLGVIVPVLKDAGAATTGFGQLVIAAGSIADFGAIILLSLFFSEKATGTGTKLALLGVFAALVAVVGVGIARSERWSLLSSTLARLQDTTAQIRVRGAFLLLIAIAAVAQRLGFEIILGAFAAGAILTLVDRDELGTHPEFRRKLEAAGYGIFIPIFFVTSGLRFDLGALFGSVSAVIMVPVFLAALLLVRGLPARLYRRDVGAERARVAALLQATSLPFIVAATQIGLALGLIGQASAAALVAAGLLSVVAFPALALTWLKAAGPEPESCADLRAPDEPAPAPPRSSAATPAVPA